MLLRLCVPLIVLILLKNLSLLDESSERMVKNFEHDYQTLACAHADVYRRNLEDAFHYLALQYPYLAEQGYEDEVGMEERLDCKEQDFRIFRESNDKLPWIYPNWIYRETAWRDGLDPAAGLRPGLSVLAAFAFAKVSGSLADLLSKPGGRSSITA